MKNILKVLAKTAIDSVTDNILRWDSVRRTIAVSEKVISYSGSQALKQAANLESVSIVVLPYSYEVCMRTEDGRTIRTEVIPKEIRISGDCGVIYAELPGGIVVKDAEHIFTGVALLFDRAILGGRSVAKVINGIEGVQFKDKFLTYAIQLRESKLLQVIGPYLKDQSSIPMEVDAGWLVFHLESVLPSDCKLNWSQLARSFVLGGTS